MNKDRIIPDCIKSAKRNETINVRNPHSIRPYQHVLEPLYAYLKIAKNQYENENFSDYYNVGPNEEDCIETGKLVDIFCKYWGNEQTWTHNQKESYHESNFLKLDCSKIKNKLKWKPTWNIQKAIEETIKFEKSDDKIKCMDEQIKEFFLANNEILE